MKKINLEEAKKIFEIYNYDLFCLINEIDDDSLYFYEAEYEFRENIMKEGIFYVNYNGKLIKITDHPDDKIKKDLIYNEGSNPLAIVSKNSIEIYKNIYNYNIPHYGLISEGSIIGIWPLFEKEKETYNFCWDISSGSKSIFMLQNIGICSKYEKINENYNLSLFKPNNNIDHSYLFKKIYNFKKNENSKWTSKLILFPINLIEKIKNDKKYSSIKSYLLQYAFQKSKQWRDQFVIDLAISIFVKRKRIKQDPIVIDTIKNLLSIATNGYQAFKPIINEIYAPCALINRFYEEEYKIEYEPTLMAPCSFNMYKKSDSVYYSLEYVLSPKFLESNKSNNNKIDLLTSSILTLNDFLNDLNNDCFGLKNTNLNDINNHVSFTAFHSENRLYGRISNSILIPKEDKNFVIKDNKFSNRSPFLNGCIRISKKN